MQKLHGNPEMHKKSTRGEITGTKNMLLIFRKNHHGNCKQVS